MRREFPQEKQRYAVCNNQWQRRVNAMDEDILTAIGIHHGVEMLTFPTHFIKAEAGDGRPASTLTDDEMAANIHEAIVIAGDGMQIFSRNKADIHGRYADVALGNTLGPW
jgi:hypothetical protein